FGWTHAYFGGMPFPNLYPPLFYWCVSLLVHTHLFPFTTAFKLVTTIPVLLIPAAMWLLGWKLSGNNLSLATAISLAVVPLLADGRFLLGFPAGLDYFSTFQIGLYTPPLGFVLVRLWYISYIGAHRQRWQFALSCLLLALTILANFFNAATASIFIAANIVTDLVQYHLTRDTAQSADARNALIAHLLIPAVACCLTLFWLMSMLSQYAYLATRPSVLETGKLITPALWVWYALAVVGGVLRLRRPT